MTLQRQSRTKKANKGNRATRQAADHATRSAAKRLQGLFPDLFDILIAEERQRRGLEPFPFDRAIQAPDAMTPSEIIDFARVFDALDEAGVEVSE